MPSARPAPRQNVWERPKDTVDALQTIPPHPVFLHVTGRPAFVRNVLRVWPNVCTLSAVICGDDAISSIIPAPHVLQSLFVGPEDLGGFRPQEFPALRTLELSHASRMNRHLRASSLLPQIRTLSVPGLPPSQDVLGALRQLESLVFGDLPIAMSLPQTLRHVGYHEPFGYRSPEQNSEVFLQALCELENLHLVTCTVCSTAALREALHEQCHARRVDFVVYMHASCAPGVRTPEYYPTGALGLPWLAKFSAPRNV
ncbi:hypothetical protein FA95DRAFT_1576150 [Auriscalpium vulgare]|uniref:Uncharacterized protein n=1 Tax=Auriscalpium vulgare TaxID=40419 RepID=A0ACB8RDY7_9AGAM|nr:hypothetical protein FA95DRAFT_1576150 [Auriscalpium vulgare]